MAIYTHDGLVLYSTEDKFYAAGNQPSEVLEIDRINFELRLINSLPSLPPTTPKRSISAIVGIIHLLAGPYLLVVTEKRKVGELEGHVVWEVKGSDVIPFAKTNIHLNEMQARDNKEYVSLVQQALSTPGFYFSHTYDLSHSQQRLHNGMENKPNFAQLPLHERGDERFVWNAHVLRDLTAQSELRRFAVPLIHGFVAINNVTVNGKTFVFALISRRNWHRAGTRYFVRGLDADGNAANYVETEQMIWYAGQVASYVQTRGSIPLLWSQTPNIKYKPTPTIHTSPTTDLAVQRHLDEQIALYGRQVLVNLIDQKGKEKLIGESFARQIAKYNNGLVRYLHFDFHKECSMMRWERLSLLMNQLDQDQISFGYFFQNGKGSVDSHQGGVFRVNCMDSLDRTNVVQSMLARRMLQKQLLRMRIISLTEKVQDKVELEKTFKTVWADNADYCSLQYAGTGALKTDFTRTGKRTFLGPIKDGLNSATRYYYNNFADGYRQDAMDLFLGVHVVSRDEGVTIPSVLQQPRSLRMTVLPLILVFSLAMLFITFLLLPASEGSYQVAYMLFWAAALVTTLLYILRHGTEFVNTPRFSADPFSVKKGL